MDVLDYMERESADTLKELMRDWAGSFERTVRVATWLTGGAGALLAYLLAQPVMHAQQWVMLALSLAWLGAAGYLVMRGLLAQDLDNGANVTSMVRVYGQVGGDLMNAAAQPKELRKLRMAGLNQRQAAIDAYVAALNARAAAMNHALQAAVAAPVLAALVAAVVVR